MVSTGERTQDILDSQLVGLQSKYLQVDEIWTYVGKKQAQLTQEERQVSEYGDQYVFVALDAETKLVPAFRVGKYTSAMALSFMRELQTRICTRFQLSTDAFSAYTDVVDRVFGKDIDYGQIHKNYREEGRGERRYSPPCIVSVALKPIIGEPKRGYISTSYVEGQNLTMRMQLRRFTRLTNTFSKKLDNLKAALPLHFFHYNFMRVHQSLRLTPAMQAGISKHIWVWDNSFSLKKSLL